MAGRALLAFHPVDSADCRRALRLAGERSAKANRAAGLSTGMAGESALVQALPRGAGGPSGSLSVSAGVYTVSDVLQLPTAASADFHQESTGDSAGRGGNIPASSD